MVTPAIADVASPPPSPTTRGPGGWAIFLALLLLALIVFLIFPMETVLLQPWVPALQVQLRALVSQGWPYVAVALLGAVVGLAEITSTFPNYPREALRTQWAKNLVLINAIAAALALGIAQIYAPATNLILMVLGVGIGFQAIIRTRFTLAKQIGGSGQNDVSLNLGWLYEQFQNLCKTQIDLELMNGRRTAVTRLIERYPTLAELHDIAEYTIISRATLAPDEAKARMADFARTSISLKILENGGQAYVDLLLSQPETAASVAAMPEDVVKRLMDKYSLADLVTLAMQLTTTLQEHDYIQGAAQPVAGVGEASQKATIAHFLVQRVGVETVLKELNTP
jgi:hypothetical protein